MFYYTRSVQHIAITCSYPKGNFAIHTFPDGELNVVINDDVKNKEVVVCASLCAPGETPVELLLLLDALQRLGAHINLMIMYFGYARQDKPLSGHPLGVQVICRLLQPYNLRSLSIVHAHSQRLHEFISFEDIIPYAFFKQCAQDVDCIIAPDKGAETLAQSIAQRTGKTFGCIEKKRISDKKVEVKSFVGDVEGKNVLLVDDMISTGGTLIQAAEYVKQQGARTISAAATHGLFVDNALQRLQDSIITRCFVTNSLYQKHTSAKLTVIDIGPLLCDYLQKR